MSRKWVIQVVTALIAVAGAHGAWALSPVLKELEDAFIALHEKVRPTVVNIDASTRVDAGEFGDLFRFFGMPNEQGGMPQEVPSQGSGFIYSKDGHIITNNHVVEGASSLTVRLWDGTEYKAKIVGRDEQTDLAVIKIEPKADLPAAVLGDSDAVRVGQFVVAIGSPQGLEGSLSFGHVSALGRNNLGLRNLRFENLIQTDAAINLGNSGGPLVDLEGRIVGINTAIVYRADSLGFATPINMAKKIVPRLISEGRIRRGYLGVQIRDAADFAEAESLPDKYGAYVTEVREDTPAQRAGIVTYDVIRKVNGENIATAADLQNKISDILPGATVNLEVMRNSQTIQVALNLEEFPDTIEPPRVEQSKLGVEVVPMPAEEREQIGLPEDNVGVRVSNVEPGSPLAESGIVRGDVILEVAKQPVTSVETFNALMDEHAKPGKSVLVRIYRQGRTDVVQVRVDEPAP